MQLKKIRWLLFQGKLPQGQIKYKCQSFRKKQLHEHNPGIAVLQLLLSPFYFEFC